MDSNNTDVLLEGHLTGLKGLDINYSGEILSDDEDLDDLVFASSSPRGETPPERPAYPGDGESATQTMVKREVIGTEAIKTVTITPTPSSNSGTNSATPVGSRTASTGSDQNNQKFQAGWESQQGGDSGLDVSTGFALQSENHAVPASHTEHQISASGGYQVHSQIVTTTTTYSTTVPDSHEAQRDHGEFGAKPKQIPMADEFEVHRQQQPPADPHNKMETMSMASSSSYVEDSRFDETMHHSLHNEFTDVPAALTPQTGSTASFDLPNDDAPVSQSMEKANLAGEIDQSLVLWQTATESASQHVTSGSVSDTITDSDITVQVDRKPFSGDDMSELPSPAAAPIVPKLDLSEDSADRTLADVDHAEEMMSSRSVSLDLSNVTASDRVTPSEYAASERDGKTSIMSLSPVPDIPEETIHSTITTVLEAKTTETKTWLSSEGQAHVPAAQSTPKVSRKSPPAEVPNKVDTPQSDPIGAAEVVRKETSSTTEILKPPTEANAMIKNLKEKLRAKSSSEGDSIKPSSISPKPMKSPSPLKSPTPSDLKALSPVGGKTPTAPGMKTPTDGSSPSLKQLSHQLAVEAIQQRASIRGAGERSGVPTLPLGSSRPSERLANWREKEKNVITTRETRKSESATLKSLKSDKGVMSPTPKRRQSEVSANIHVHLVISNG